MWSKVRYLPFICVTLLSLSRILLLECNANDHEVTTGKKLSFLWDENGYVFFCLCMGRIGNKIDHFLGGLAFAKSTNRTLVLPPIRTYKNVPFDEYFQVAPLQEFHRVITAADFLQHLAPSHWPPGSRVGFCYGEKCDVKKGNPHGPFWDDMNIHFDETVAFGMQFNDANKWMKKYPASRYPVLAMRGAPAPYPVAPHNRYLQQYLRPALHIEEEATHLIRTKLPDGPFIGIHLRNGNDWVNACKDVDGLKQYMSSPQCTNGPVTKEMCLPSVTTILSQLADVVESSNINTVFVATDKNPMIETIQKHFKDKVKVYHLDPHEPMVDQAILIQSAHFIGNCVSSFTAFVTRSRAIHNLDTSFWGV